MTESEKPSVLQGKKILIVEDDPFLRDIISQRIGLHTDGLAWAGNSIEVFENLEKQTPDLVLLDIVLPGKSGFEILEQMKADVRWKDVQVIMLSNLGQKQDIDRAMSLGAKKFLVKVNITPAGIVKEIEEALS